MTVGGACRVRVSRERGETGWRTAGVGGGVGGGASAPGVGKRNPPNLFICGGRVLTTWKRSPLGAKQSGAPSQATVSAAQKINSESFGLDFLDLVREKERAAVVKPSTLSLRVAPSRHLHEYTSLRAQQSLCVWKVYKV